MHTAQVLDTVTTSQGGSASVEGSTLALYEKVRWPVGHAFPAHVLSPLQPLAPCLPAPPSTPAPLPATHEPQGKPSAWFTLVLQGKVHVCVGSEGFATQLGPWNYMGLK